MFEEMGPTPGRVKSGKSGQFPSSAGSPPMRTQCECDGVGPSRTQSWCQPGGEMNEFGGAVIVQVVPEQENSGKRTRAPMLLPCVLDVAAHALLAQKGMKKRRRTSDQGDVHRVSRALEELDRDLVLAVVVPVVLSDIEGGLRLACAKVWRDVHLDTELLGQARRLRVTSGDKHTAIGEELDRMNGSVGIGS